MSKYTKEGMEDALEKLDNKLESVDKKLDSIDKTMIRNTVSLEIHMRRTDILENSQNDLKDAVKPILKAYTVAWGITKIISALAVVAGICAAIASVLNYSLSSFF